MPTSATINPPPRGLHSEGFALVEMMLALAIVGLVAVLALPWTRPSAGPAALRSNVYRAAALIRADRTAAQLTGRIVETVYDFGGRTLRSGASGEIVTFPVALAATVDAPGGRFRFYPDGRSSGGALTLASPGDSGLGVMVDAFTAAVEIRVTVASGG